MPTETEKRAAQLEQLVRRQLAGQPPLRAPSGLEARVLAAIAAQSRPWYSRGFQHWPLAFKALFLLLAAAAAFWLNGQSVSVFAGVARALPAFWLEVAVVLIVAGCATLLAGGVFAYHTIVEG
jgi:hypothetical protein